jgi:archaeosortase A (PGF-CTERM-specific)
MLEYLIALSCIFFLISQVSGAYRRYTAAVAWITMIIVFLAGVPAWIEESNILYPVMAVLSIPFLIITLRLIHGNVPEVMQLTRAAAVAWIIYAPFAFIAPVGDLLISLVVSQTAWLLDLLGYHADLVLWSTLQRSMFRVEIILACTGIQAIAIMLGVASAVPTTMRQKIGAFLLVAPTIYILNLFRNAGVIVAYTDQWFSSFPDISGSTEIGYSSFFWAHNIAAEGLALVLLIGIAYALFRMIPALGDFAVRLVDLYEDEVRKMIGRGR